MQSYGATQLQLNDIKPALIKSDDISDYFGNATEFMLHMLNGQGVPQERISLQDADSRIAAENLGLYVITRFDSYDRGWQSKFARKVFIKTSFFEYSVTSVDPAILMPTSEYATAHLITSTYQHHKEKLQDYDVSIEGSAQSLLNNYNLFELQQKIAMCEAAHVTRAKVRIEQEILGNDLYFIKLFKAYGTPYPSFQDHLIKNRLGTYFAFADQHGFQKVHKLINDWRISAGRIDPYDLVVLPAGSSFYYHHGNKVMFRFKESGEGALRRLNDPMWIDELPGVDIYENPENPKSTGIPDDLVKLSRRQVIANNFFVIDGSDAGAEIARKMEPLNVEFLLSAFHMDQSQGDGVWKRYGVANGLFSHTNKWNFDDPNGKNRPFHTIDSHS